VGAKAYALMSDSPRTCLMILGLVQLTQTRRVLVPSMTMTVFAHVAVCPPAVAVPSETTHIAPGGHVFLDDWDGGKRVAELPVWLDRRSALSSKA